MKQAKFYLLDQTVTQELPTEIYFACELAAKAWRAGKKVMISCQDETQAFAVDEALWARDPNQFVPHNLSGEMTNYATPIEISWQGKRNAQRRDILINLQTGLPEFVSSFNEMIDFVPVEEQSKVLARERYKQLRQLGWQLATEQVANLSSS